MAIRPTDPDKLRHVPVLPLEFHGAAMGYDEDNRVTFSLIFRPQGEVDDPDDVDPDTLVQVLFSEEGWTQLGHSIASVRYGGYHGYTGEGFGGEQN